MDAAGAGGALVVHCKIFGVSVLVEEEENDPRIMATDIDAGAHRLVLAVRVGGLRIGVISFGKGSPATLTRRMPTTLYNKYHKLSFVDMRQIVAFG